MNAVTPVDQTCQSRFYLLYSVAGRAGTTAGLHFTLPLQAGPVTCGSLVPQASWLYERFNFDAIAGQIRSLLGEDSLKDVNISFG